MQNVSQAWKDVQCQTLVPVSYVEVKLSVTDPEAAADVQAADSGHMFLSDTPSIVEEEENEPRPYALPERNLWVLDGSRTGLPAGPDYGRNGFVSGVLAGADGTFSVLPTITLSFSKVFTSLLPGLTIQWGAAYGDYASRFRVTVYRGSTVVSVDTVENRDLETVWVRDITGFDKIVLEVLAWCLPGRRARIAKLRLGMEKLFRNADLMSYRHSMEVDPLSAALPKMEITFSVKNLNGEYDPYNPTGVERYMMQRQRLQVRYGYKLEEGVEWINGGTFYLSGWDMPQNGIEAGFTARDLLEYMSGKFSGEVSGSLGDLVRRAFGQAGLPAMPDGSERWAVDPALDDLPVPAGLDLSENTLAEVVQYAANAACCVMLPDREGRLVVGPLPAGAAEYPIDRYVSYANAELSLEKQLRSVNVNNGQYVLNVAPVGDDEPVTNPLISDEQAPKVARWTADFLTHRNVLSGTWRADPRLDPLDRVENENRFGKRSALVTEIEYTYNGAFRGSYSAREGA